MPPHASPPKPGRRSGRALVAPLAVAIIAAAGAAQPAPASTSLRPPADAPPPHPNRPGPYKVLIESPPNLGTHTVYRPADLGPFTRRGRLPIVAWGNGACSNAGLLFSTFLTQVASHGYLVLASGPKDAPLPAFARRRSAGEPQPTGAAPAGQTHETDLLRAIDWATTENARPDSPYFRRLDPSRVAVMGQSCGGLQATAVAGDPRIDTVVIWNSGVFVTPRAAPAGASMGGATKASLERFHAPVAYFLGGAGDLAYANGKDDFARLTRVPAFLGSINSGHGGTFDHPGGGWFGEVGVKWLDWRLKGDAEAATWFVGKDCLLCRSPVWEVDRKNMN